MHSDTTCLTNILCFSASSSIETWRCYFGKDINTYLSTAFLKVSSSSTLHHFFFLCPANSLFHGIFVTGITLLVCRDIRIFSEGLGDWSDEDSTKSSCHCIQIQKTRKISCFISLFHGKAWRKTGLKDFHFKDLSKSLKTLKPPRTTPIFHAHLVYFNVENVICKKPYWNFKNDK